MTVQPHVLRRYVIERANGRTPRHEWEFYAADISAWIGTDETSARRHEHHHRIRVEGRQWCDVLGHRTDVAEDWHHLEIAGREHPKRCLRNWSASRKRIMAAVASETAAVIPATPGPLDGWPAARGEGQRSLLPR